MREFVVVISYHVMRGHEAEYIALVTPVLDAMRHEKTFINTVLNQDPEDPTQFMLYETWIDKEDFLGVQMKREYRKPYEARLPQILRTPRTMQFWQFLRGDFAHFAIRARQS
jgi:quinol monooxygenase YgiN